MTGSLSSQTMRVSWTIIRDGHPWSSGEAEATQHAAGWTLELAKEPAGINFGCLYAGDTLELTYKGATT